MRSSFAAHGDGRLTTLAWFASFIALALVTGCSASTTPSPEEMLESEAMALAESTGCRARVTIYADVSAYPRMAGVNCITGSRPVLVRAYESALAAARAVREVEPLVSDEAVLVAGDRWLAVVPAEIEARLGGQRLTADQLERAQALPADPDLDDLDFCIRWATTRWEEWASGRTLAQTDGRLPPQLEPVAATVKDLQQRRGQDRAVFQADLESNLWRYESRVSEIVPEFRDACSEGAKKS